jgi:hypothetical protein
MIMTALLQRLALASAALLLLASCSDSDSPDSSEKPDASENADSTGGTVAHERFCPDIDPEEVGSILGVDGLEVVVDTEPGQPSPYWTCTIGQASGTSIGVTMNLLDADANPATVAATLDDYASGLGADNCTNLRDETLGAGTRGVDCSGTSSGTSFTMVARAVVVGGTQIECLLASYRADDLGDLQAAAPEICGLFRDRVVS